MNHEKIKRVLLESLEAAAKIMREDFGRTHHIEKKTELSIVTESDKKAEAAILARIKRDFPDHAFLTEESPAHGNSGSRWIIDPIDGTTNFAHGFPQFCTSIAFEEDGVLKMGGIYDPMREELYFAERGKGATLNGKPIHVSKVSTLIDSLVGTGFGYDRRERADEYLAIMKTFMMKVQCIRRAGAAALDLCYLASGRFDVFYEQQLQSWDKAAGIVIVEEAGGKMTDFSGGPITLDSPTNCATNGILHPLVLELFQIKAKV